MNIIKYLNDYLIIYLFPFLEGIPIKISKKCDLCMRTFPRTSNSISQHIKNNTLLLSPSFKNDNKSIKNSYYMNDLLYKRNHNKFINKNNFRLFDL